MLAATLIGGSSPASAAVALDKGGKWTAAGDWPLIAIHAALDKSGKVLTYGSNPDGSGRAGKYYDIWTPGASVTSGHSLKTHGVGSSMFCGLQITRPDNGNIIMLGGGGWTNPHGDISQYNPSTGGIAKLPSTMKRERWYGTVITLPDGSIYVQGGAGGSDKAELWSADGGSQLLPFDTSHLNWWYPRLFVLSDGRIFGIDGDGKMFFVSQNRQKLTMAGTLPPVFHGVYTSAVMFKQDKILYFGGSNNASIIIDVTSGSPVVKNSGPLSSSRKWADATLLPDGRVLATGGAKVDANKSNGVPLSDHGVNYAAEIWNPATGTWTVGDQGSKARLYHSTSLLLADGRVLVAGGGKPGPVANQNAELYSPDYLVKSDGSPTQRPAITSLSASTFDPGVIVSLGVQNPANISRVTLLKTGSVTHSFNVDQRFFDLKFGRWNGQVRARIPGSSAAVTPGQYLLTVIDNNGIPSKSKIVKINSNGASTVNIGKQHVGSTYRLYLGVFGRAPKASGLEYWTTQRTQGRTLKSMAAYFSDSPEFKNRYGAATNDDYVNLIYQNILNRPPKPSGKSFWLFQLKSGMTRPTLMLNFTESQEFKNQLGPVM